MNFLRNHVLPGVLPVLPQIVLGLFTLYELFMLYLLCALAVSQGQMWGFAGGGAAVVVTAASYAIPGVRRFQPDIPVPIYHRLKLLRVNSVMYGAVRVVLLMMLFEFLCMVKERDFGSLYRMGFGAVAVYFIVRFCFFHMRRLGIRDAKKNGDSLPPLN
ncbi:hypothetical protein FACS1894120_5760 [Clostridia bacterium]|nr:hypothetical protein FACS1894120_5760 [Clostridia bacterium]